MTGLQPTLRRLKRLVSRLVLKGPILRAWVRGKCKRLERRYAQELISRSSRPLPEPSNKNWAVRSGLKQILFISDIQWENKELVPELEKICPVSTLNLRPKLKADARTSLSDQVCALVSGHIDAHPGLEPDFILFYARSALLSEEVFHLLRKRWSCPLAGMNLDDKMEFLPYDLFASGRENYRRWAELFDLNLTNVRAVLDWYRQEGLAAYYMPEGYHPRTDCPYPEVTSVFKNEIAFVGSWRPEREVFFHRLWEQGIPLLAVGDGWPISEPGKNPNAVYRATMINLGLGFASPSETLTTLKTRDFECPGTGACYLTTYNWELALHYEIGKEILCYRSTEELIELFAYYRRRPSACLKIAQAAYERCRKEHTWERRFSLLFQKMGLVQKPPSD